MPFLTVQDAPHPSRFDIVGPNMFADITPKEVVSIVWEQPGDTDAIFTFATELTDLEWVLCRRRLRSPAREALELQAQNAIVSHNNFLALTNPTNAQVVAHVKLLSRVDKGLIKTEIPDLALLDGNPNA